MGRGNLLLHAGLSRRFLTISYHAHPWQEPGDWCCGHRVLSLGRHDYADAHRPVIAAMNQEPPQRCDRLFRRAAGFLGTMVVQIIG